MKTQIPEYIQNPNLPITITVIGCGGTGSILIQQLARIAYAYRALTQRELNVIVCDGDKVEQHNIGRQLFAPNELGYNKAEIVVGRINRFYGFKWLAYGNHFSYQHKDSSSDKTLRIKELGANIVFSCTDNIESRKEVRKFTRDCSGLKQEYEEFINYFWIDCGNTKTVGQVIVGSKIMDWPDRIDLYGAKKEAKEDKEPSCSLAMSLNQQDLFINTYVANIAAKWLWELLTSKSIHWRGAFTNLDSLQTNKLKINAHQQAIQSGQQPDKQETDLDRLPKRSVSNGKQKSDHNYSGRTRKSKQNKETLLRNGD